MEKENQFARGQKYTILEGGDKGVKKISKAREKAVLDTWERYRGCDI